LPLNASVVDRMPTGQTAAEIDNPLRKPCNWGSLGLEGSRSQVQPAGYNAEIGHAK